jgi:hypothetical protein
LFLDYSIEEELTENYNEPARIKNRQGSQPGTASENREIPV